MLADDVIAKAMMIQVGSQAAHPSSSSHVENGNTGLGEQ
jgi:hypothetical protein